MKIWLYPCLTALFFTACSIKETKLSPAPSQTILNFKDQQDSHYAKLEFDQNISILSKMNQNINLILKNTNNFFLAHGTALLKL